ncbi:MAG: formate dehydrogenase accessory sulfurtransferase FdhD [Gammaproteobacteria bacterium]|nr:formate dehydrogenase accessory sulfurtransferase FdhD [Gammaproteobacteria bacterium]
MPAPAEPGSAGGGCVGAAESAVLRIGAGTVRRERDWVALETPVALVYNGEPHAVMMATPCDLQDFALGFSLTEDIIDTPDELSGCEQAQLDQGLQLSLRIPAPRAAALAMRGRSLAGRTGCGLCGARVIEQAIRPLRRVPAGKTYGVAELSRALRDLRRHQLIGARTGAVHAAAWAAPDGEILALREDVGRHNALDKLIGALLVRGQPPAGFLVMTSRASYEIVQKAARLGAGLVVAISAPTELAVRLAGEAGMTLVGFARGDGCVIYSAPARLRDAAPAVA